MRRKTLTHLNRVVWMMWRARKDGHFGRQQQLQQRRRQLIIPFGSSPNLVLIYSTGGALQLSRRQAEYELVLSGAPYSGPKFFL